MKVTTLLATVLLAVAGCSGETATEPTNTPPVADTGGAKATDAAVLPSITYYELNEVCPFCIKIRGNLEELEKEYAGKIAFSIIGCRTEEGVDAAKRNGWVEYIHGLEARDAAGTVVGQIEGHQFSREDLVAKVQFLLGDAEK